MTPPDERKAPRHGMGNGLRSLSPLRPPWAEAAPSPRPRGPKGAADRRRAGDGALVARPGFGSAPRRGRQGSAGRHGPRGAKSSPPVAGWAMGRALSRRFGRRPKRPPSPRPGGSGPPPRRRRSIGSATRPGSAPNPTALHKPWRKASTSIQRKAALRWAHQGGAAAHLPLRPARAEAAPRPSPGGSGPPPLRQRSSGSANRPSGAARESDTGVPHSKKAKAAQECRTPKSQSGTGVPHSKKAKAARECRTPKKPKRQRAAALQRAKAARECRTPKKTDPGQVALPMLEVYPLRAVALRWGGPELREAASLRSRRLGSP